MIRLENVLKISLQDVLKTSSKRLEDVLKTYGQDEYIGLDQDVFWRRKAKTNIFVLIKTSSEDEDERRLQDIKTSSSRRMFAGYFTISQEVKVTKQWNLVSWEAIPRPFYRKSKLCISLDQGSSMQDQWSSHSKLLVWISSLKCHEVYFYCMSKWRSTKKC